MTRRSHLTKAFVNECKKRLLEAKVDILNRITQGREELQFNERPNDSGDQSFRMMEENEIVSFQNQWRAQLMEIEKALSRIDHGSYGICEETEEPIEPSRLKAIPWTRFSLEGAEMRDSRRH